MDIFFAIHAGAKELMFFWVSNTMEVLKHPDFAPFFAHFNFVKFLGPK